MTIPNWFEPKITVGNLIQLAVILVGGMWTYFTLTADVGMTKSTQAEALKQIAINGMAITTLRDSDAIFNTRMTIVERRADGMAIDIGKMADVVHDISTTTQSLVVTSATTKTDVGYIRDWVEELRRKEREARGP